MSMGIIDLVGRGLGCESCGIVSASRAIFLSLFKGFWVRGYCSNFRNFESEMLTPRF